MARTGMMIGAALVLAGCGQSGNDTRAASGGFKAMDACATLDKAVVAGVMKVGVVTATLGDVSPGDANSTTSSSCDYALADGRLMKFVARQFPRETNTPDQMAEARRQLTGAGMYEVVPGIDRVGLYNRPMNQLAVYFGPDRYFDVIFPPDLVTGKVKGDDPALRADAIAIAHRLGA